MLLICIARPSYLNSSYYEIKQLEIKLFEAWNYDKSSYQSCNIKKRKNYRSFVKKRRYLTFKNQIVNASF